ncbi:MAG: T9SS type A sorting domain-containing protein, partial [Flavobacterium sp.]
NLNGKIDLQGRSQLVQTTESDLEVTSAGLIERDQQGTTNKFNYNYWSSPVGPVNTVTNNNDYTLNTVFKDGTNPVSPVNINWIGGYDSTVGTPINLCRYWTFKFQNVTNDYANWTQVLETGTLAPAQGYTLKGSNAVTLDQNYTFIGKPFNGTITNPIAANNLNLSGNPYASALDASKFITDNASSLTGTLYFWEHYTTNSTHNLAEYQGGYATRNLTGGVPPVAPALVSGLGSSTRVPGRFIPVGQGFFVSANATGGTIEFNNSQRAFVKEDDVNSNEMFRNNMVVSNQNDSYEEIEYEKIRLGFTSNNNYHRQVLLGFMNNKATNEIDYGYDGLLFDEQSNDMFFTNSNLKLIIQGEGYFNENNIYPLTVTATTTGTVKFMLDGTENFNPSQPIYIHNSETNYYHDLRDGIYEVSLTAGTHSSTFSLRFKQETLSNEEIEIENGVNIIFTQNNNTLSIKNNLSDTTIQKIHLFNLLGQNIETWDVSDEIQQNISVSMDHFDIGTYIVKTVTTNGDYSKKIIKN